MGIEYFYFHLLYSTHSINTSELREVKNSRRVKTNSKPSPEIRMSH